MNDRNGISMSESRARPRKLERQKPHGPNGTSDLVERMAANPVSTKEAEAALLADKEARAKEYGEILTREGDRLRCSLMAVAEIAGTNVNTRIVVIPR